MSDLAYAAALARRAQVFARARLSEERYVEQLRDLVDAVLSSARGGAFPDVDDTRS